MTYKIPNYDRSVSGDLKLLEKQKVSFSESISVLREIREPLTKSDRNLK